MSLSPLAEPRPFEKPQINPEKIARVRALYEREQEHRPYPKALTASDIPQTYECVTGDWLKNTLGKDVQGAEVTSFKLGPPDNGTANRRHIYIEWNATGQAAGLPASVFCKATQGLQNRLNLCWGGLDSEITWFNELRANAGIRSQTARWAKMDPESYLSIVMLDDMSDLVDFANYKTRFSLAQTKDMVGILAQIHGTFWNLVDTDPRIKKLNTYASGFQGWHEAANVEKGANDGWRDAEAVIPCVLHTLSSGQWLKDDSADLFKKVNNNTWPCIHLATDRNAVLRPTLSRKTVTPTQAIGVLEKPTVNVSFLHLQSSSQKSNWLPTAYLMDFQCLVRSHPARDLAYFLSAALEPEDRRAWLEQLLDHYHVTLEATGGPKLDRDQFFLEWRVQLWTALASWTPTYRPTDLMPAMQPEWVSIEMIRRISSALHDYDAYEALDAIRDE